MKIPFQEDALTGALRVSVMVILWFGPITPPFNCELEVTVLIVVGDPVLDMDSNINWVTLKE